MQNTAELIYKAMTYGCPEEIPVSVWFHPAAMKMNGDAIKKVIPMFPAFFGEQWLDYDYERQLPASYRAGCFTDEWGCVWSNMQEGMEAYVTGHPLSRRSDIKTFEAPKVDAGLPHGFMYLRLLDLRGFDEAMFDFADECDELQMLIDKVCDYNVRQMELICKKEKSPYIAVGDDLGMQQGLAIGPVRWRKYLKPAFKRIYDVCAAHGKLVYMHTDGDIIDIMNDIVDTGVSMVNPQYRANGIDRLVEVCKGKIPIMLDLDRQLFPYATPNEMRDHAREAVEKLYLPEGGLGINLEFGFDTPIDNIVAILSEMDRLRTYRG